jgi:hypothetical protein
MTFPSSKNTKNNTGSFAQKSLPSSRPSAPPGLQKAMPYDRHGISSTMEKIGSPATPSN